MKNCLTCVYFDKEERTCKKGVYQPTNRIPEKDIKSECDDWQGKAGAEVSELVRKIKELCDGFDTCPPYFYDEDPKKDREKSKENLRKIWAILNTLEIKIDEAIAETSTADSKH